MYQIEKLRYKKVLRMCSRFYLLYLPGSGWNGDYTAGAHFKAKCKFER